MNRANPTSVDVKNDLEMTLIRPDKRIITASLLFIPDAIRAAAPAAVDAALDD